MSTQVCFLKWEKIKIHLYYFDLRIHLLYYYISIFLFAVTSQFHDDLTNLLEEVLSKNLKTRKYCLQS